MKRMLLYLFYFTIWLSIVILVREIDILNIYFVFSVILFHSFVHELGHVLAGTLVKIKTKRVALGKGKQVLCFNLFGIDFRIHLLFFLGGTTWPDNVCGDKLKFRLAFFIIGGNLATLLVAAILIIFFPHALADLFFKTTLNIPGALILGFLLYTFPNFIPRSIITGNTRIENDPLQLIRILFQNRNILPFTITGDMLDVMDQYKKANYPQAHELIWRIIEKNPLCANPRIILADISLRLLDFQKAKEILLYILDHGYDEDHLPVVYNNLAWVYLVLNENALLRTGLEYAEKAYRILPQFPAITGTYASLLIETGNWKKGEKLLCKIIRKNAFLNKVNVHPLNYLYLGYSYFLRKKKNKVKNYIDRIRRFQQYTPDEKYLVNLVLKKMDYPLQ